VIAHESGIGTSEAFELAALGEKVRNLKASGLEEGVSTRLLIYAAQLMRRGVRARAACSAAVTRALSDDPETQRAIDELCATVFP